MTPSDLLSFYKKTITVQSIHTAISSKKTIRIKGLVGSSDAVVSASSFDLGGRTHLYILHDKEEAAYFYNDLLNFTDALPTGRQESQPLFFPESYKKPYAFEEIENANVLQRAEVLNALNTEKTNSFQIVTYPDALYEKVINRTSLTKNTFSISKGERLDIEFFTEILYNYDFERVDFVYEAGQFSVRGGIIDVFSFGNSFPCRLEFFGDELESIREFDPESQLSIHDLEKISLIPNVQQKLSLESRQSFLSFLPENSVVWVKDYRETLDLIDKGFQKAEESFSQIMKASGNTKVVLAPSDLFDAESTFSPIIQKFSIIEFGTRFSLKPEAEFKLNFKPQPNFNKNFAMVAENLFQLKSDGYKCQIWAEAPRQLQRLETIFEELNKDLHFEGVIGSLREGFIDTENTLACYADHQIFERFHQYKKKTKFSSSKSLTLRELKQLQPGDYIVHIDYGVGRFAGLDTVDVNGSKQEALRVIYKDDDLLYVSIHSLHKISKYSSKESTPPPISKLGSQDWENKKKRVKKQVKDIAKDLISLYAKRKAVPGYAFPPDDYLQAELESSFIYQDTPDQALATADVKRDMETAHPMDRLVCGDVGFGKTEVAIRAAFKAVNSGRQVAVLVPTTILALQHHKTFIERLSGFPITVDYINRFKSAKQIADIKKKVKDGSIEILIGTHRIVNKDIEFKDLGLMVIDEEQKFGVKVKERLKEMRVNVDCLTLTATPIPRTLHFSLMGARDLSIISTPPPNRRPVTTEIHTFNEEIIRDAIRNELRRGGQVFFVHNRVSDIEEVGNVIYRLVPDAKIGLAHGQMDGEHLEKVMLKFMAGEYDVLVSTNIIESGLDIPNANTIIINRAHMFGLSDLHQMRGRVGRSNIQAFCYLLTPPVATLTADSRKRLITLEEFSDLGDGFKVAMRDLDIRGAGNLLGSEQSGFINDMGFDVYHKILDEAVAELKEDEFRELFETGQDTNPQLETIREDCTIETDLEILIPESYVSNISERLSLYTQLDNIADEKELQLFKIAVEDRFGKMPPEVVGLIESVKMRSIGSDLGFEKITLKSQTLKCFISDKKKDHYFQSETFGKILDYVKKNPNRSKMKEVKQKLQITISEIGEIQSAIDVLNKMAQI